jgi:organic radical activating enzyme
MIKYVRKGKYLVNPDSLTQISMIVTRDCNIRCSWCVEQVGDRVKSTTINVDKLLRAVDKVLNWHEYNDIVVTGGEPLIADNIDELLKGLKKRGLNVFLNTNGMLLLYKLHTILPYVDKLGVSIHDVDAGHLELLKGINKGIPIRASIMTFEHAKMVVDELIDADCVDSILLRNQTYNSASGRPTEFFIPIWLDNPISSEVFNNFDVYYSFVYRGKIVRLKHAQNDKMREQLLQVNDLVIEPVINPDGTIGRWWDDDQFYLEDV